MVSLCVLVSLAQVRDAIAEGGLGGCGRGYACGWWVLNR